MKLDALLEMYRVDTAHARQVADHALALFDQAAGRYKLPAGQRRLLEIGALLHNVGLTTDPPAHHLVGRDILLRHPPDELRDGEGPLVASLVAFHRKRVRPGLEPAYLSLGKKAQGQALRLAALLRVADGLDYSQSQSTRIVGFEDGPDGPRLRLSGPHAAGDGERAVAKADLWRKVFGESLSVEVSDEPDAGRADGAAPPADAAESATLAPWYAAPDVPLAELGRVLLRRHLRRLLAAEREVRADKEIEAVHSLRVATRRLRATLRLVAPVGPTRTLRAHGKAIGRLARCAGAVRDRDVLLADLAARGPELPEQLQPSLEALRAALQQERDAAHRELIAYCDSDEHAAFCKAFARTIGGCAGWDEGPRVRDLGGSTLWRHYEALRAHDHGGIPADPEELHAMRIDGKRMRYVLELFGDTLGPRADEAVAPLTAFQDHLGGLNDVAVARGALAPFADDEATAPAVAAYLALREQHAASLHSELPAYWAKLNSGTYRRKLMELIIRL
jgi:CHAD domain-containing protein